MFALTEYDYNEKNLLTEKREYYNKVELVRRYEYEYNEDDLCTEERVYHYWISETIPERHYLFEYNDNRMLSASYEIDTENGNDTLLFCQYDYKYYPDSTVHYVFSRSDETQGWNLDKEYYRKGGLVNRDVSLGFNTVPSSDYRKYNYDKCNNWTEKKEFEGYAELGLGRPSGLIRITEPYVERRFTYYE